MPAGRNHLIIGGIVFAAVAASWVAAYRLGAGSGRDLAMSVTGTTEEQATPPAPPPPESRPHPAARSRPSEHGPSPASEPIAMETLPPAEPAADPHMSSPGAIDAFLDTLSHGHHRDLLSRRLQQAAQDLGLSDVPDAIDALAALPAGPGREAALLAVIDRWGQLAPEAAIGYAVDEAIPTLRTKMIQSTFAGWARNDPAAALAYLEQNPEWEHQQAAGRSLFETIAERPMADALYFLESVDEGAHGALIHRTISRLMALDPLAVRDWALAIPETPLRETVVTRSVTAWANYAPVEAKNWIMDNYEGDELSIHLPRLAGAWARNDPEAARDWYLDLPEDLQTSRVGEELFESWLDDDQEAAAAYLDQAEPSEELDQGFRELAHKILRSDPSRAMDLAEKITNDKVQSDTQSRVARNWAQRNPRALLAYLESSSIPAEEQAPLIRHAESRLKQQTQRNQR